MTVELDVLVSKIPDKATIEGVGEGESDTAITVSDVWEDAIVAYAKYRALSKEGEDQGNQRAIQFHQEFEGAITGKDASVMTRGPDVNEEHMSGPGGQGGAGR